MIDREFRGFGEEHHLILSFDSWKPGAVSEGLNRKVVYIWLEWDFRIIGQLFGGFLQNSWRQGLPEVPALSLVRGSSWQGKKEQEEGPGEW